MNNDLVSSFKKASSFKREISGQKYTLWFLWEREFKKLHAKAPFSGKNLAVIFWALSKKNESFSEMNRNVYSAMKDDPDEVKKKKPNTVGTWSRYSSQRFNRK
jgi:hypothetical protein